MSWLRFSFESKLDEIFLVSLVLRQVCTHIGLDEILAYQVELCAIEAVTNSVRHALHEQPGNEVTVLIRFDDAKIDLQILDCGASMPPTYVERLKHGSQVLNFDPSDIQALPESGMGLQIIHDFMDEAVYTSNGGVNCLRLMKLLRRTEI